MKQWIRYIRIFFSVLPELRQLIRHVVEQLPKEEHVAATKHAVNASRHIVTPTNYKKQHAIVTSWDWEKRLKQFAGEGY